MIKEVIQMKTNKVFSAIAATALALCAAFGTAACASNAQPAAEQKCEHTMTRVERRDSTCTELGNIAHYSCSLCGNKYFDEAGSIELTEQAVSIAKNKHSLEHYAATEKVAEHWRCIACDRYFTDAAGQAEARFDALFAGLYDPVKLADVEGSGNIFDASAEFSPLYDDFTFRCFITWKNADGKTLADFSASDRVQVNINLNRVGAGNRVDWYNFGIGYSKNVGLFYKPVQSGDIITAPSKFTKLFIEQGGIYVVVMREGAAISAYFEDADGKRTMFTGGNRFGADEALERLAANTASRAEGWTATVTQTALCLGIADIKCIFDKTA